MQEVAVQIEKDFPTGAGNPIEAFRQEEREQGRIASLFELIPKHGLSVLDVGARDGYLSLRLSDRFRNVVALDLTKPACVPPGLKWIIGNAAQIPFPDRSFDLVLCAEVLEHIPAKILPRVCAELSRVSRRHLVLGVPYDQDIRLARTTCRACRGKNPPYGHVNEFKEQTLDGLFPAMYREQTEKVGRTHERTNFLSTLLYDWAGNPFGTYEQEELCIHCGAKLIRPSSRSGVSRALAAAATYLQRGQVALTGRGPNWIHVRYGFRHNN